MATPASPRGGKWRRRPRPVPVPAMAAMSRVLRAAAAWAARRAGGAATTGTITGISGIAPRLPGTLGTAPAGQRRVGGGGGEVTLRSGAEVPSGRPREGPGHRGRCSVVAPFLWKTTGFGEKWMEKGRRPTLLAF